MSLLTCNGPPLHKELMSSWNYGFRPYVSAAERRAKAGKVAVKLSKKGEKLEPVSSQGRTIASSFWGKAWCTNLEAYSDYENRLPRGRSYLRNGSVVHLALHPGRIEALVSGSSLYKISIGIKPFPAAKWKALCGQCAGQIGSLVDLLQGKLSDQVMAVMTKKDTGLFPSPSEIQLGCSCPDWADMCKHVAAVLYGVGVRLDTKPELLFTLRSVNQNELLAHAASATQFASQAAEPAAAQFEESQLAALFGIELDSEHLPAAAPEASPGSGDAPRLAQPVVRKAPGKKLAAPLRKVAKPSSASSSPTRLKPAPKKVQGPKPSLNKVKPKRSAKGGTGSVDQTHTRIKRLLADLGKA